VVEFITGSRGEVPGKTCDKINNNDMPLLLYTKTILLCSSSFSGLAAHC
jgi:hypothetical protein